MYHHDLRCTGVHVEEIRQLFWTELCDSLDSSIMKGMYSIPSSSVNRRIAFHFSQAFIEMGYIVFKWMQFQWTTNKIINEQKKNSLLVGKYIHWNFRNDNIGLSFYSGWNLTGTHRRVAYHISTVLHRWNLIEWFIKNTAAHRLNYFQFTP